MADDSLAEQLIWLLDKSRLLIATRETDKLVSVALNALVELTHAERAYAFLMDHDAARLSLHSGRDAAGHELGEYDSRIMSVATQALRDRRSLMAADNGPDQGSAARSLSELRVRQLVCLPLVVDNEPLGVLYADGKARPAALPVRAAELLAGQVASAYDNARMFERAMNDLLTGLPNNSYFLVQLSKVLREASASTAAGVLLLDLDSFKRVNQAGGAEVGDRALVDVAHTLREVLRSDGLVARYGSDKFAILLPPDAGLSVALRLRDAAERARAAIGTKVYCNVALSASIGGVSFPAPKIKSAQDVINLADNTLARARSRGAGEVEIL